VAPLIGRQPADMTSGWPMVKSRLSSKPKEPLRRRPQLDNGANCTDLVAFPNKVASIVTHLIAASPVSAAARRPVGED
jgi:hypothetical protein